MTNKEIIFELEKSASQFRLNCGFSSSDPIRWKSILQKNKILTIYKPLSNQVSGASVKIPNGIDFERYMLINSNHSIGRQHFTICHELYHLMIQKEFSGSKTCLTTFDRKSDPNEYYADVFASFLLLPESGVKMFIPPKEHKYDFISIQTILEIEHYFSASRKAVLYRLKNMNLISDKKVELYSNSPKKDALRLGYSTKLYENGNENDIIGDYGLLAYSAWEKGIISESVYYNFLSDIGIDLNNINTDSDGSDY